MHPQLRFWRPPFCLLNYTPMAGVKRFALPDVGIKIRCLTAWLNPNVLLVFPSRQRYAVCLLRYTATSSFSASCFRWRGKFVAASVLSNRTGKPLPCHKLSAIHVHRRIVATTSCGKYFSRLFFIPFNHNVAMLRPTCPV